MLMSPISLRFQTVKKKTILRDVDHDVADLQGLKQCPREHVVASRQ